MRISERTMKVLAAIIAGENLDGDIGFRSAEWLVHFFYEFGSEDIYSSKFPDPLSYTIKKLKEYNGTNTMVKIIEEILDPKYFTEDYPNNEDASKLKPHLKRDGYKLIPNREDALIDQSGYTRHGNFWFFEVQPISDKIVEISDITKLDNSFINKQIDKANKKLDEGDYDGAITNARSLVEEFLQEMIRKSDAEIPNYEGDLLKLYKGAKQALNLDPSQKDLSNTLKQVLTGLTSIVIGISGLSNKMGDRHSPSYRPRRHHARLVVNAAFTFCEFLLESYEYQQSRKV